MLKNLQIFRAPLVEQITAEMVAEALGARRFARGNASDGAAVGWVSPTKETPELLTLESGGAILIALRTEEKILPASVIKEFVAEKIAEIEAAEMRKVGRKRAKELKEEVTQELRPRAFPRSKITRAVIDTQNGLLIVDSATRSKAEAFFTALVASIPDFAGHIIKTTQSPPQAMTFWVDSGEPPPSFTIDADAKFEDAEGRAQLTIRHANLDSEKFRAHIKDGNSVTSLALSYADRVSFVLTSDLQIKRFEFLDLANESLDKTAEGDRAIEEANLILFISEFRELFSALTESLGGEVVPNFDLVEQAAAEDDDLYPLAVEIVKSQKRASISLVQRHLRIGYNRAARLLELMEKNSIISGMKSNGSRELL